MILLCPLCHPALSTLCMAVCPQATLQATCYPYRSLAKAQFPGQEVSRQGSNPSSWTLESALSPTGVVKDNMQEASHSR